MPSLLDYYRPQPRPDPFAPFNSRVTYYAPGPGDRMEGGFETSRPNPQTGKRVPSTLDDVRLGTSPYVTLAGDPSRYGQTVKMGPLTYTSPLDQKSYTLPDVTGYVHDTGSAFKGRPDKLDVAAGDYRGYSPQAASAAVTADAGRRTVTPLEGDEADRAMRPIGMPEPWRATGEGYDQTAVAQGPPPPQQGQKKMPNSLLDMFQPRDPAGEPVDIGNAVASRSNSLIGLGLGLLSPSNPLRGQSGWSQALEGYQGGAALDTRQATSAAQLRHQKSQEARQAAMDRFNMGFKEREFSESQMTEAEKLARASGLRPGTQEHQAFVNRAIAAKAGETPTIQKITNPATGEDEPVLFNPRGRTPEEMFRPLPSNIFGGGTPAPPAAPAATPGFAPAPLPVQPPALQPDVPGTTAPIDPNAPSATSATAAPTTPRGPADLPPRVGPKAFEPEEKLRKEFNLATKVHQEVRQSYNRLLAAKDSAAGDIALIFGYMRMLDPGSVVREGEFATAQNAAGIPDMVRNMYNRALSGERLNPNQRNQFKDQAGSIYDKYDQEYSSRAEQFRGIARQNRIDPARVIPDLGPSPRAASAASAGPDVSAIDPRAIKALKADPKRRDEFDAKYGEGAAMRVLTGK